MQGRPTDFWHYSQSCEEATELSVASLKVSSFLFVSRIVWSGFMRDTVLCVERVGALVERNE